MRTEIAKFGLDTEVNRERRGRKGGREGGSEGEGCSDKATMCEVEDIKRAFLPAHSWHCA